MITGIDHVHVLTTDLDKSLDFWISVLGFRMERRVEFGPPEQRRQLAYAGLGNVLVEFLPPTDNGHPELTGTTGRPLCLAVQGMEETVEALRARGVEVATEVRPGFSFWGKVAAIKDPCGIAIELREWRSPDAPYFPDWQPERSDVVKLGQA
jgi:catechol 2,3-dioxygenase-like lactoylglutathione lyase family enzyme